MKPIPNPATNQTRALRSLYDEHMRRRSWVLAFDTDFTERSSRYVAKRGDIAMLMWHRLPPVPELREWVTTELEWFKARTANLLWKVYGHDSNPELKAILQELGGKPEDESVLHMASTASVCERLQAHTSDSTLQAGLSRVDILRAQDVWIDVWPETETEQRIWGEVYSVAAEALPMNINVEQPIRFWTAHFEGQSKAVGAGYMVHGPGIEVAGVHQPTPVALLCGGAVREAARRQGIYKSLLKARAEWALSRGAQFMAIEASPMSAPIVQSLSFEPITDLVFYKFEWS